MSEGAEYGPRRGADALPDSAHLSGRCSRCGNFSDFGRYGQPLPLLTTGETVQTVHGPEPVAREQVVSLICRTCGRGMAVVEARTRTPGLPWDSWHGRFWWPLPEATGVDDSVPEAVASAYAEANLCVTVGAPNAGAAMLRTVLARIVQDKGGESARNARSLVKQLEAMATDGTLAPALADWATHIRELGNAGGHPEVYGEVSGEEAEDLRRLVEQMIATLYVVPASIERSRAGRGRGSST